MKKTVSIVTTSLFNRQGTDFVLGGNERYLLDMISLYNDLGYRCHIFQPSSISFEKKLEGNLVVGVPFRQITNGTYIQLNRFFQDNAPRSQIYHYQSFTLAYPHAYETSVGVCHGVSWDRPIGEYWESGFKVLEKLLHVAKRRVLQRRYQIAAKRLRKIVANDTNFINWTRVLWPDISAKITYIPNYVDLERFEDVIQRESDGKIRVLFPRRLSHERGFLLALSVARELSGLYSQVEFHFTGDRPSELVDTEMGRKDGVHFQKYQFDDMHMAYANADIVIIPTIHSEGTSLSCLEALASGKAVVASDVGGLPNLIVDGFNGLLIRPNRQELKRALETLINNKELRERLSRNALSVAQVFSKKRWREKWEMEIKELEG